MKHHQSKKKQISFLILFENLIITDFSHIT